MAGVWDDWVPPSPKPPVNLEPMYGPRSFVPATTCREVHGAIPRGSARYCEVCGRSGQDHRPMTGEPIDSRINPEWAPKALPAPTTYAPADDARGPGGRPPLKGGRS